MNDTPNNADPLEAELLSMRPAEVPPEMYARVGQQLSVGIGKPRYSLWLGGAMAAAAACVAVGAALAWRAIGTPGPVASPVAVTVPASAPAAENGDDRPALVNYHRAMSRSPADLDDLLNRHAARALAGGAPRPAAARVTAASTLEFLR